jgi:hypothetical protein
MPLALTAVMYSNSMKCSSIDALPPNGSVVKRSVLYRVNQGECANSGHGTMESTHVLIR